MSKVHDAVLPLIGAACDRLKINRDALADIDWYDNDSGLIGKLTTALDGMLDNYDGAIADCDSAVEVLIRRIKGEADLDSAREWVCLNYPNAARKAGFQKAEVQRD